MLKDINEREVAKSSENKSFIELDKMKGPSEEPKKRRKDDLKAKIITDEECLKAIKDKEEPLANKCKFKKNTKEGPSVLLEDEELGVFPIDKAYSVVFTYLIIIVLPSTRVKIPPSYLPQ